jgi:hypothetical protein
MSSMEELRRLSVYEGPLDQSMTAKTLYQQLSTFGPFKGWKEKKWFEFAQDVKSNDLLPQVFSGAFAAFVRWMGPNAGKLPATTAVLAQTGLRSDRYDAEKLAGIMSSSEVLEPMEVIGSKVLKYGYSTTPAEAKRIAADPKLKVVIWMPGEGARQFIALLSKYGISAHLKEGSTALPPFLSRWDER